VIDFHCPKLKLAIEIDGLTHMTEEEIEFLRFNNQEVYSDLSSVGGMIKRKVKELSLKSQDPHQPPPCLTASHAGRLAKGEAKAFKSPP